MLDVVSSQVDCGSFGGEKMSIVALKRFVEQATKAVSEMTAEDMLLQELESAMADLVSNDDWLPEQFGRAHERYYRRYLLHCDPLERFSVVSLVWGAGQGMSVHNHTVWGVVGMLRGAEINTGFEQTAGGSLVPLEERRLETGEVARHSPDLWRHPFRTQCFERWCFDRRARLRWEYRAIEPAGVRRGDRAFDGFHLELCLRCCP
ncbi:hypothetical protein [Devosia ginsengisoli]|uniref:cysteine dioxygenase family protein n=1 Tax=Devosia ginsengisoli TaxID=400770 RepID=UPI0026EEFFAD|nr:hypothetical protein [Devosia ginsengisoli]MCR6671295.1 hypothetical protein [Devosia ginsengisoli]